MIMKIITVGLVALISSISAFAVEDEICGRYVISEDAYEDKPANEFIGFAGTTHAWTKYYLKPRGESQRHLLQSMEEGEDYCVTGTLFWCGEDGEYRCMTVKNAQLGY